jgi:ribosomal protein L11 methyltransferase
LDDRKKAEYLRERVNKHLKGPFRFKIKKIKNENWKTKHAKNFSIFALTKQFDVVPSWRRKGYCKTARTPIIIDSINAFGTGLHETTSFMAHLIERMEGKFKSFLDIGTGTGLLAMIALKCGAQDVQAIDFDPDAVVAAKRNLKVNGYPGSIARRGDIERYRAQKRFDLVAANLITRDLIKYKKQILSTVCKNGFLAISGIMIENLPLIRKAFGMKKLRCIKIYKGEQWVAFLYKRIA